jgi:hypothetical protein
MSPSRLPATIGQQENKTRDVQPLAVRANGLRATVLESGRNIARLGGCNRPYQVMEEQGRTFLSCQRTSRMN